MGDEKKNLKVLMLSATFYPDVGGKERQALQLSRRLISRGVEVSVLTQHKDGLPDFEILDGIKIYRKIKAVNLFPLWTFSYIRSVYSFLMKNPDLFDVIHCHQIYLCTIAAIKAGKKLKKPVIAKKVSTDFFNDLTVLKKVRFSRFFFNEIFDISGVVAICEKVREETVKDGFPPERIFKIPNGVDIEHFSPTADSTNAPRRFLFVGRLTDKVKGISFIIEGFRQALKLHPGIELHIVGDGEDKESLKKLTVSLNLNESVFFHNMVSDPLEYYRKSDALILASKTEGLSNVLLEAMSSGVPAIATAVGGNPEMLYPQMMGNSPALKDGEIFKATNGILIPYGSAASICRAICEMLASHDLYSEYRKRSRAMMIKDFSLEKIAGDLLALYNDLIEKVARGEKG